RGDLLGPDLTGDVGAVHLDGGGRLVGAHGDDRLRCGVRDGHRVLRLDAVAQHPPGDRAVHRPRDEVGEAARPGDALGRAGLARTGRPVDGDDDARPGRALHAFPGVALRAHVGPLPRGLIPSHLNDPGYRRTPPAPPGSDRPAGGGGPAQPCTDQPCSLREAASGPAASGSTESWARPSGWPGEWSIRTSSMFTPAAPTAANSRPSAPGSSGRTTASSV